MGDLEFKIMLIVVFKLCGQVAGAPRGVEDQSKLRVKVAISPAPWKKLKVDDLSLFTMNLATMILK
jgi:hypothetical protein